jgi:hypothetical protein
MHNCATIEEAIQFLLEKEPIINNLCSPSTHAPSLPSSQDEDELYPSSRPAAYCARLRTACRFLSPSRDKPSSGRLLTNIVQAHEQRCNKRQEHKTQMRELITTNGKTGGGTQQPQTEAQVEEEWTIIGDDEARAAAEALEEESKALEAARNFNWKPSVGTWLHFAPPAVPKEEPVPIPQESSAPTRASSGILEILEFLGLDGCLGECLSGVEKAVEATFAGNDSSSVGSTVAAVASPATVAAVEEAQRAESSKEMPVSPPPAFVWKPSVGTWLTPVLTPGN